MFLGATLEFHNTSSTWEGNTQQTTLNYLMNFKNIAYTQSSTGTWNFVGINGEYFSTVFQMLTFDFSFFDNPVGEMVRWIVFIPISCGILIMIAIQFITLVQGFIPFT